MDDTQHAAHIVVIDDNPSDVYLLRYALSQLHESYELEVLRDGEQALQFVNWHRTQTDQPRPCVIVLDLHLPRYDGLSVLRAIKKEPVLAHIHVVILTAQASPDEEYEMLRLGVRLYRAKPTNLEELAEVAAQILEVCKEPALVS